jgi:hypothetical protein
MQGDQEGDQRRPKRGRQQGEEWPQRRQRGAPQLQQQRQQPIGRLPKMPERVLSLITRRAPVARQVMRAVAVRSRPEPDEALERAAELESLANDAPPVYYNSALRGDPARLLQAFEWCSRVPVVASNLADALWPEVHRPFLGDDRAARDVVREATRERGPLDMAPVRAAIEACDFRNLVADTKREIAAGSGWSRIYEDSLDTMMRLIDDACACRQAELVRLLIAAGVPAGPSTLEYADDSGAGDSGRAAVHRALMTFPWTEADYARALLRAGTTGGVRALMRGLQGVVDDDLRYLEVCTEALRSAVQNARPSVVATLIDDMPRFMRYYTTTPAEKQLGVNTPGWGGIWQAAIQKADAQPEEGDPLLVLRAILERGAHPDPREAISPGVVGLLLEFGAIDEGDRGEMLEEALAAGASETARILIGPDPTMTQVEACVENAAFQAASMRLLFELGLERTTDLVWEVTRSGASETVVRLVLSGMDGLDTMLFDDAVDPGVVRALLDHGWEPDLESTVAAFANDEARATAAVPLLLEALAPHDFLMAAIRVGSAPMVRATLRNWTAAVQARRAQDRTYAGWNAGQLIDQNAPWTQPTGPDDNASEALVLALQLGNQEVLAELLTDRGIHRVVPGDALDAAQRRRYAPAAPEDQDPDD